MENISGSVCLMITKFKSRYINTGDEVATSREAVMRKNDFHSNISSPGACSLHIRPGENTNKVSN